MIGAVKVAAALMLGLALTGTLGAQIITSSDQDAPETTNDVFSERDFEFPEEILESPENLFDVEDLHELPGLDTGELPPGPDGSGPVAIALAARWGYLGDPPIAMLGGEWRMRDDSHGGFRGRWHLNRARVHGSLWGQFDVAPDGGRGRFTGEWDFDVGRAGGYLAGFWEQKDGRPFGMFAGRWNFTDGRPGGALRGEWHMTDRDEGEFRGLAIRAPTIEMVPWDGFVKVGDGGVKLIREVLFEHGGDYRMGGDDKVFPQRERDQLGWRSSTTVHWDGLIMGILAPGPDVRIAFNTLQWSKTFTVRELVGLHIRVPVDRLGHEIELRGFLVRPPPRPDCVDGMVKVSMMVRWGNLDEREDPEEREIPEMSEREVENGEFVPWNGFIQVTMGGVVLRGVLDWERGGDFRKGEDDFVHPRENRLTIEWRSSTYDDWDGIIVNMCLPLRGGPMPHVTIHTDQWSHVFGLDELRGLNEEYEIEDDLAVHVVARIG